MTADEVGGLLAGFFDNFDFGSGIFTHKLNIILKIIEVKYKIRLGSIVRCILDYLGKRTHLSSSSVRHKRTMILFKNTSGKKMLFQI